VGTEELFIQYMALWEQRNYLYMIRRESGMIYTPLHSTIGTEELSIRGTMGTDELSIHGNGKRLNCPPQTYCPVATPCSLHSAACDVFILSRLTPLVYRITRIEADNL
jgi:hypothetical protein